MEGKAPEEERTEPRIEVDPDLEELENHTVPDWKTRTTTEKKPITRWVIGPILAVALAGLGYAFWLVWRMEPAQTKTSPLAGELAALKGEVQKMTPEMEKLRKELDELKIENKTTVEQLKGFQAQLASMSRKVETVVAKKPEPTPPPPKKPEPVKAKKAEPAPSPKTAAAAPSKPTGKTFIYKVKPGESVFAIGRKFKVDPDEILRLNDLPPKAALQAGQLLTIQSGSSR